MILISPTRTLSPPLPIDTDPILNYRHIQPAAAAAAVVPWLCSHHHTNNNAPSRHSSLPSPIGSCSIAHNHSPLEQPFTTLSSKHSLPPPPPATRPPLSDSSASPSSTLSIHLSAASATSGSTPLFNSQSTPHPLSSSPPSTMLPNPTSDDDSSTADEDPSLKPSNASLATAAATPQQFDSHSSALSLYDPPTSSSAPPTSSSFPSSIPSHQPPAYATSSPHPPTLDSHQQYYNPSPPALHSPLHPTPQHSFDQRPQSSLLLPHQPYHSRPQSAPHSTSHVPLDPHILAAAANVEVKKWDEENTFYYQVIHKGIAVGRVKGSGLVNGTKLLNLSGISRGKRDGILKNEKIRKVVKHGTMHLKGVWIAYDRACHLADQYHIADKIFPLLVLNLEHYVHIEQQIIGGAPKIASNSLFHHHRGHPRLLPQPIKFPSGGISLAPTSAGSFSSSAGWSAGPSSGRGIDFGEPYSAPPVGRNDAGASSVYEQAQYDYLHATNSTNPDLMERRHTIPNNYNGYHPMVPFGSPQPCISYPFQYAPSQPHLGGYPPRTSGSDSAASASCQFEYPPKSHLDAITNRNGSGSYSSVFNSQPSSTRPSSTSGTHTSPALHSTPLILGDVSPLPSSNQVLDHPSNDFQAGNASSSRQVKEDAEEDGCAVEHEDTNNAKARNFQDNMSSSGSLTSPFSNWNLTHSGIMNPKLSENQRIHRNPHAGHMEEPTVPESAKCPDGQTTNAIPNDIPPMNNSEFNGGRLPRPPNSNYQAPRGHSQSAQDASFHINNLPHPMGSTTNLAPHNW